MKKKWHDDDAFWQAFAPAIFTADQQAIAPVEIDHVLALTGLSPGCEVLDLCCGPGRHSLELARRGFQVTAVDRTEPYLAQARTIAQEEKLDIEFVRADMREFIRPAFFHLAINLYTSFSYFEDQEADRKVVENLYQSLRPGGVFVLEMMSKEVLARIFRERDWKELPNGALLLEERRVTRDWGWIENRWLLVQNGQVTEHCFGHRLYSGAELIALLESTGFIHVELFGNLAGEPYDHRAERLVAVAYREAIELSAKKYLG